MAFLEQLGKKLTTAGQEVAQQTKIFTDITRLNGLVADKEKHMAQLFRELGKIYYEQHKDAPGAKEAVLVEEIRTISEEIEQYREDIKQIKGVAKCAKCGAELPLDALFCPLCGEKVGADAEKEMQSADTLLCPQCQSPVFKENLFCNVCGAKIREET